jgi:hypothetical protein
MGEDTRQHRTHCESIFNVRLKKREEGQERVLLRRFLKREGAFAGEEEARSTIIRSEIEL